MTSKCVKDQAQPYVYRPRHCRVGELDESKREFSSKPSTWANKFANLSIQIKSPLNSNIKKWIVTTCEFNTTECLYFDRQTLCARLYLVTRTEFVCCQRRFLTAVDGTIVRIQSQRNGASQWEEKKKLKYKSESVRLRENVNDWN